MQNPPFVSSPNPNIHHYMRPLLPIAILLGAPRHGSAHAGCLIGIAIPILLRLRWSHIRSSASLDHSLTAISAVEVAGSAAGVGDLGDAEGIV